MIEPWPFQVKLQPGQPGFEAEVDLVFSSGLTGCQRYVEWRRTVTDGG